MGKDRNKERKEKQTFSLFFTFVFLGIPPFVSTPLDLVYLKRVW